MKIVKPSWVNYKGEPIISIHFHPDGKRFATGGVLNDSGQVSVWSTASLDSESASEGLESELPHLLSQMTNHHGCVNCVRWNHSGNWLASAGVDKGVLIWQLRSVSMQTNKHSVGPRGPYLESWSCLYIMRGHSGEVLDLSWSLSDEYLASCSVDNTIIIWNGVQLPAKHHIIKQHSGMVKGLCWDPIGKYLASQSDDRTLRVWRTEDWSMETKISQPFNHCSGTTHLLRLSWSPDGRNIVTAHALNNTFPVSHIVDRNNWQYDKSFVGHQKAIEVAAFNSNLFSYDLKSSQSHTIVALGSKDSSISIWNTAKTKPILLVEQVFSSSILDLSWSSDGYRLLACSWDSSIALLKFSEAELGYVLESSLLLRLHMEIYGCTALPSSLDKISTNFVFETPKLLALQNSTPTITLANRDPQHKSIQSSTLAQNVNTEQVEIRTKDGKRRITPLFISPPLQPDHAFVPHLTTSSSVRLNSRSNSAPSMNYHVSSDDLITQHNPSPIVDSIGSTIQDAINANSLAITSPLSVVPASNNIENISVVTSKCFHPNSPMIPIDSAPNKVVEIPSDVKESSVELDFRSISRSFSHETPFYSLHIDNIRSYGALLKVTSAEPNSVTSKFWDVIISSKVISYCCSSSYVVTSCVDCSLHIFTSCGRRLVAPLLLPAQLVKMVIGCSSLLVVTSKYDMYMWEFPQLKCVITAQPVSPLLINKKVDIINLTVKDPGPILTLSNDTSFLYNKKFNCWQSIQLTSSLDPQVEGMAHPYSSLHIAGASSFARNQFFLESQLNSSLAMNSRTDLQRWLFRYVQFLSDHDLESQLRELFSELLQPLLNISEIIALTPIQALVSHNLVFISNLLELIARNVNLQKVYSEFSEFIQFPSQDCIS
ncbi:Protein HIRA-like protein isoform X1 [Oopsacas minuta]|uniref:Protein HIRA n=1 Tax=Oopsacas minuta TaxID=111878 RepID=A0AAV7JJM4_9METZ|nr:Protein HIRA-like protein isoform X1 [Oopsacas minuta]